MINELFSSLCKEKREKEVYLMQYNVRANKTNGMWRCFVRVAFQMNAKIQQQQRHTLEGKMMWGNLDEEHKSICQTFDVMNIFRGLYCEGFSLATLWCKYDLNWKGKDWKGFWENWVIDICVWVKQQQQKTWKEGCMKKGRERRGQSTLGQQSRVFVIFSCVLVDTTVKTNSFPYQNKVVWCLPVFTSN